LRQALDTAREGSVNKLLKEFNRCVTSLPGNIPRVYIRIYIKVLTEYVMFLERKENKAKNKPKKKFRPTADVLSRIRHDAAYSPEEFLIGYEDRYV
jgi:hypothetical protein